MPETQPKQKIYVVVATTESDLVIESTVLFAQEENAVMYAKWYKATFPVKCVHWCERTLDDDSRLMDHARRFHDEETSKTLLK